MAFILLTSMYACKLVQPLWQSISKLLRKMKIDLPQSQTLLLLSIYPKKAPLVSQLMPDLT